MKIFLLFIFSFLINHSLENGSLRKLEDNPKLEDLFRVSELKIYNNTLIFLTQNLNDSLGIIDEKNSTIIFTNYNKSNQLLNCRVGVYNQELTSSNQIKEKPTDYIIYAQYKIECPITFSIYSNFENSKLEIASLNKTIDIMMNNQFITYKYEEIKFLTFGNFQKLNDSATTLNAYFIKPKDSQSKNNLFFCVKIQYKTINDEWVYAEGIKEEKYNTLIYNITFIHEKDEIININSINDFCFTSNNSYSITYCDVVKNYKRDMKIESKIILFYNSTILNQYDKNIKIEGNLSQEIIMKNNSKNFKLNYYRNNSTENDVKQINCSLDSNKTIYKMFCNLEKESKVNFLGAFANITDLIENNNNLRILAEGKGTMAFINGEEEKLVAEFIPKINPSNNSSKKLGGGAIAGIIISCVVVLMGIVTAAICLSRNNSNPNERVRSTINSTSNINEK